MLVCPNCSHSNPEEATQCEACFSPLATPINCPDCGNAVQNNASFCGQCGFNLQRNTSSELEVASGSISSIGSGKVAMNSSVSDLPDPPAMPNSDPVTSTPNSSDEGTLIQEKSPYLLHLETGYTVDLPRDLLIIRIGKSNSQVPPDIDLSSFPNSEIVSRRHAEIHLEDDEYYIEDVGSSNGTYVNHSPLHEGMRHRLMPGDLISFGKEDKVTFIFKLP